MTYYEVLEIDARASTDEIERAFRRLARKVHPDLNAGDAAKAEARMKLLNEIRDTLTDPLLRAGYDERLRLESLRVPPAAAPSAPHRPAPAPPPEEAPERGSSRTLWVGLFVGALGAGVLVVALVSSPRVAGSPTPLENAGAAGDAPLLVAPVSARHADAPPEPRPARGRPRGRGVIRIGSSADDVLRVLGPPDSYEPGPRPGESVLRFGTLRLEMKNGRVAGGDAAAR